MKKLLPTFLIVSSFFACLPVFGQITIDQSNFTLLVTEQDSIYVTIPTGLAAPTTGPDQTWDYSGISNPDLFIAEHLDAADSTDFFPNAITFYRQDLGNPVSGEPIEAYLFEGTDDIGWFDIGLSVPNSTLTSLTPFTGGPNDELVTPAQRVLFSELRYNLKFPATYESTWTNEYSYQTQSYVTVEAFALSDAPVTLKVNYTEDYEVIGYGQLSIPNHDGAPMEPVDVLQFQRTVTEVDSVFLNGSPAPDVLLDLVGMTQGQTFEFTEYGFSGNGYARPVMIYETDGEGQISYLNFRPKAARLAGQAGVSEFQLEAAIYPNPVAPGALLNIKTGATLAVDRFQLFDLRGREVANSALTGTDHELRLPTGIESGLYLYKLSGENGKKSITGKLVVK